MTSPDVLRLRAQELGLHGLLSDWDALRVEPWLEPLLERAERERSLRSLQRRIRASKVGRFKPMADFDFRWPKKLDREQIDDLFTFQWLEQAHNVILVGPNGVGKSMIAQNLTYEAVKRGANALFVSASEMLNDLAAQDGTRSLQRRLSRYCRPRARPPGPRGNAARRGRPNPDARRSRPGRQGPRPVRLVRRRGARGARQQAVARLGAAVEAGDAGDAGGVEKRRAEPLEGEAALGVEGRPMELLDWLRH
jgi:hypothetical protein